MRWCGFCERQRSTSRAPEFVGRQDVRGLHGHRIIDRDRRLLRGDLDLRQARGAARGIAGLGHDGEDDLAMKHDLAVGENRIVAMRRTAIIHAGNIGGGEDGDDARISCARPRDRPWRSARAHPPGDSPAPHAPCLPARACRRHRSAAPWTCSAALSWASARPTTSVSSLPLRSAHYAASSRNPTTRVVAAATARDLDQRLAQQSFAPSRMRYWAEARMSLIG